MADKKENPFENLPIEAAEYIKFMIKKIRYRRKVRNDVQKELIAHFQDALIEITDPQEKQATSKELIEHFGDAKMLAILTRRAKKRCRPLWIKAVIKTAQVIGIILLFLGLRIGYLAVGSPTIKVDYAKYINELIQNKRDESLNAYPDYLKASEVMVQMPKWLQNKNWEITEFTDSEKQQLAEWLNQNRETFEYLAKGAQKPYFWCEVVSIKTDKQGDIVWVFPDDITMQFWSKIRRIATMASLKSMYSRNNNQITESVQTCKIILRLGNQIRDKSLVIQYLIGISIQAMGLQQAKNIMFEHNLSRENLVMLKNEVDGIKKIDFDFLKTEKAFLYNMVQNFFTDDKTGNGKMLLEGLGFAGRNNKEILYNFLTFNLPDRQKALTDINCVHDLMIEYGYLMPFQQKEKKSEFENAVSAYPILINLQVISISKVSEILWRLKTHKDALLVLSSILIFKADKGIYPDNLQQLIDEGYLTEIPIDPFSGKPIKYKKTDGNFILYSVGLNMIDDGGVSCKNSFGSTTDWADNGDTVFWSPE